MLAVIKHVNSTYKPETEIHTPPNKMPEGYHENLSTNLRKTISRGNPVFYTPNLAFCSPDAPNLWEDSKAMQDALDSDSFLNTFGDTDSLIIVPDIRKPLDVLSADIAREDELLCER